MSDEQFPALGFDPAIGNIATVRNLAKQMTDTATYAKEALDTINGVKNHEGVWTGKAANAFADKLGELPKYLDKAHQSLDKAGKALTTWSDQLTGHQRLAKELEAKAKQAKGAVEQTNKAVEQANHKLNNSDYSYDTNVPGSLESAQQRSQADNNAAQQAAQASTNAQEELDRIIREAENLRDRYEDDGGVCAKALQDAGAIAPDKGFWESLGDVFTWIGEHIGEIASIVSAVAGVLSFIPILAPITGPIALAAGGIALAADGTKMVAQGKWDDPSAWIGLGADVLGVIPGVGPAAKGMSAATDSLRTVDGLASAATSGAKTFGKEIAETAGKTAEPAKVFEKIGGKAADTFGGNADTIAKSTHIGTSLISPAGTTANLAIGSDDSAKASSATGTVGSAVTAGKTFGTWTDTGRGIASSGLGSSLKAFSRALG